VRASTPDEPRIFADRYGPQLDGLRVALSGSLRARNRRPPTRLGMTPPLRTLADEADAHRYRTAFARLDERTLLRAMAAALRAYADAQEGQERATLSEDAPAA
jgi:hypothetical protein